MRISARNQLKGTIVDVVKGATTSHVRINVGGGVIMTASITNEAVDDLKLAIGQPAIAVVKSTDVLVAIET
jgi:molybdopterin-binding protein